MLQRLFESVFRNDAPAAPAGNARASLVLSLPAPLRGPVEERLPGILSTAEVFRRLFAEAQTSVKVFSPYVDPTFTSLAQSARAPIQIVTTLREARQRSNPVLERFASARPLAVRYLHEKHARAQMFQLHAKMILADSSRAYLGSANLTDTSLHYNFELGIYLEDRDLVGRLHALFDYVFDFAAKPAEAL
ncbi:MAG TPA: phospholipase D-like domain-containing protein [Planctomycetota bacterium]|nr:phospholipase D-like domain-containing protein [Planctomycetota bacterium]